MVNNSSCAAIVAARRLPAEWEEQACIQLTWPHRATDWDSEPGLFDEVTACYLSLAAEIAKRENLIIVTPEPEEVIALLEQHLPMESLVRISLLECPTNDTWARDHGLITVASCQAIPPLQGGSVSAADGGTFYLDFKFNGWGGKFAAGLDNAISRHLYDAELLPAGTYEPHLDFELEGGSIESDGRGTILTTAECNLNPNRRALAADPVACQAEVERTFREVLGAERVLWLHHGALEHDDTDSHIDTLARLCPDDTIVYGEGCPEMLDELRTFRTLEGKPYRLIAVPEYYANFLIMNGAVLVPFYDDETKNQRAKAALEEAFPDREVVGIDCRALLRQNGSLHCCTMQYPVVKNFR